MRGAGLRGPEEAPGSPWIRCGGELPFLPAEGLLRETAALSPMASAYPIWESTLQIPFFFFLLTAAKSADAIIYHLEDMRYPSGSI